MTNRNDLGAFDIFRLAAAVMVIAIHTSPLWSVNETANFFLREIAARIAVPFFFAATGYFTDLSKADKLRKMILKTTALYAVSIVIYLPFGTYNASLKMLLFDGAYFHLWYFPACVTGAVIVFFLRKLPARFAFLIAAALYIIGLFGDSYHDLAAALPPVGAMYDAFSTVFSYTRNGIFFAPLFLLIGSVLRENGCGQNRFASIVGILISFALLTAEGYCLSGTAHAPYDNMYFFLIPTVIFLFGLLASINAKPRPRFRKAAMWIYILHPIAIYILEALTTALGIEDFSWRHSFLHFLLVTALSYAAAFGIVFLSELRRAALKRIPERDDFPLAVNSANK